MPKTRPAYPPEFRHQLIELVAAGRTPEDLAEEFEPRPRRRFATGSRKQAATQASAEMASRVPSRPNSASYGGRIGS